MGIQPSKTELFLPSQTLRECHPDRCWCDRPYHRSSRYVYVERGGDGREHYQDPVDLLQQFMVGGGGGNDNGNGNGTAGVLGQMPWKDPRSWTVRDYEKLGEVMEEWASREFGKNGGGGGRSGSRGGGGGAAYPPWPGGGGGGYWDDGGRQHGNGGRRSSGSSKRYVGWDQFEDLKSNFHRMAEQYQRHVSEQDAFLFGSDTDRRKEQYRQNMLNQLKEMMPQLMEMMSGNGGGGGMPYPCPPVQAMPGMAQQHQFQPQQQMPHMPPPYPMMNGAAMPGMQMPGQMPPPLQPNAMQGMGMNMNMNPAMAAAAMQGQMMNPMMMNPMMNNNNGGGMMMDPPPSTNMGRRARRRNGFAIDDGFDDDFDEFRPRRGFKRRGGAAGGGAGNWRDDDDMFGGYAGGADLRGPRPGGRGGPPSRPPDFRPGDGGAMAPDEHDHYRSSMPNSSYIAHNTTTEQGTTRPRDVFPPHSLAFSPPLRRPGYLAADTAAVNEARRRHMMPTAETVYDDESSDYGVVPSSSAHTPPYTPTSFETRPEFTSSVGSTTSRYARGRSSYNDLGSSGMSPTVENTAGNTRSSPGLKSAMKRNVTFDDDDDDDDDRGPQTRESARLTRPRQEETKRGETSAGAMPDKRDGLGML